MAIMPTYWQLMLPMLKSSFSVEATSSCLRNRDYLRTRLHAQRRRDRCHDAIGGAASGILLHVGVNVCCLLAGMTEQSTRHG